MATAKNDRLEGSDNNNILIGKDEDSLLGKDGKDLLLGEKDDVHMAVQTPSWRRWKDYLEGGEGHDIYLAETRDDSTKIPFVIQRVLKTKSNTPAPIATFRSLRRQQWYRHHRCQWSHYC